MAIKGGYFFKVLDVDLTAGTASARPFDKAFAREYIGGRGFCARFVADNLKQRKRVDPFGPENLVAIAPGPLSGLYVPSNGKTSFAAIAPATGLYGDSNMGGNFGVELRQAGWDGLLLRGAAPALSYLLIDGNDVQTIPCPELAGKGNLETEGTIKHKLGDQSVRVATIGPAGEHRVVFACISADWSRNAGRTGMGAVWGSKNLKAIAVRGDADLPVYDLAGLRKISDRAMADIRGHKLLEFWHRQGLMSVIDYANSIGILPTYNFRDTTFRGAEAINGFTMESQHKIGDSACFACPMCCGKINLVKNGPYAGTVIEGPEYETAAMLGSNLGVDNFAAILRAAQLCDDLGIDTITAGNLIGAVMEGYERRVLTLDDLDGKPIAWGDEEHIFVLLGKIARREGIGAVLAGGSKAVSQRWPEMAKLILQVKGLEQSAYDCRGAISMALAYGTSDIGAHHARAWTVAKELEMGRDWSLEKKAELVIYHQSVRPLFDMLGVCRLPWIELGFKEDYYSEFYTAVTGESVTLEELLERSRRIYNLTRAINCRFGISRKDDYPHERVFSDPVRTGPLAGSVIDRKNYEAILDIYYSKRGWDKDGKPKNLAL